MEKDVLILMNVLVILVNMENVLIYLEVFDANVIQVLI